MMLILLGAELGTAFRGTFFRIARFSSVLLPIIFFQGFRLPTILCDCRVASHNVRNAAIPAIQFCALPCRSNQIATGLEIAINRSRTL
jgi:hypothetical protein